MNRKMNYTCVVLLLTSSLLLADITPDFQKALDAYYSNDYKKALVLLKPMAGQGNAEAQNNLGVIYAGGFGVSKNHPIAYALYNLSAASDSSNDNPATANRAEMIELLSVNEIEAGQALTRSMHINGISKSIDMYIKTSLPKKAK